MGAVIRTIAFPNPPREESAEKLYDCGYLLWLQTDTGGSTPAVHIQIPGTLVTLLYCHGNADDIGGALEELVELAQSCNASVFAVEYPGYSISDAWWPTEELMYEAVDAAYVHLTQQTLLRPASIIPFGDSLGTAAAIHLAANHKEIMGLVLISPLQSGAHVIANGMISDALHAVNPFKNYEKIERVEAMTCIVHGTVDSVVPFHNGKALYDALSHRGKAAAPLWVEGCDHCDLPTDVVLRHVRAFLDGLIAQHSNTTFTTAMVQPPSMSSMNSSPLRVRPVIPHHASKQFDLSTVRQI